MCFTVQLICHSMWFDAGMRNGRDHACRPITGNSSINNLWCVSLHCNYADAKYTNVTTNLVIRLLVDLVAIRGCCYHAYDHSRSAVMRRTSLHIHVVETVLLQPVTSYNVMTGMLTCTNTVTQHCSVTLRHRARG